MENRLAHDDGQVQLDHFLDLASLTLGNIASDGLRRALDRFGGDFQAGQDSHLLPAVIEGRLLTHQGVHAAHSGGELRMLDIQFDIGGEQAGVTVPAQIVGPRYVHRAHHGKDRFGAQLPVVG